MNDTDTIDTIASQERDLSTELVPQSDARARFVSIDPERLGGVPCFVGTRIPIKYLWEYLLKGETLELHWSRRMSDYWKACLACEDSLRSLRPQAAQTRAARPRNQNRT